MRYHIQKKASNIKLFLSLAALIVISAAAQASNSLPSNQCHSIESTSDAVICIKAQLSDAENRLQQVFDTTVKKKSLTSRDTLTASQKDWNEYKTQHCAWEASHATSPSEEHLKLMSCKILLTEQRIDILNKQLHLDETEPVEYGDLPRWLNVIAYNYPNVFWQYNNRIATDLNCDGSKEWLMIGTSLNRHDQKKIQTKNEAAQDDLYRMDFVITIAENPKIGRPQSQLFKIPLNRNISGPHICSPIVTMTKNELEDNKNCTSSIAVIDDICDPVLIYWNGKDYQLSQPNGDKVE